MAFINEYIPEADCEKYDLRRICGEHNLPSRRGNMHSRAWTVDRDGGSFLIQVWDHHESVFSGWAFCWKGAWSFFEMTMTSVDEHRPDDSCWASYRIKNLVLPDQLRERRKGVIDDLTQALGAYCGAGVFSTKSRGTATVEFVD